MIKLSKKELKQTLRILETLCNKGAIDKSEVYSMFESKDTVMGILMQLRDDGYINIIEVEEGDGILSILKTNKTSLGMKNIQSEYTLKKRKVGDIIHMFVKNAIIQLIGVIVLIFTFLKMIEAIFGCDIPII